MESGDFIDIYLKWLKDNTKTKCLKTNFGQFTEITTPFLDRHNDYIQLYVQKTGNDNLLLTDGGYTLNDLAMCGCDILSSQKRKNILMTLLNGFGIKLDKENLCVSANYLDFAHKKHSLLQAVLSVNDLFFLSHSQVVNVFTEDVQTFLDSKDVRYIPDAQFIGASGFIHAFPYTIPSTRNSPERFIRVINSATQEKISSTLFTWDDVRKSRKPGAKLYVFMNDREKDVRQSLKNALTNYNVSPIIWSEREKFITELIS